MIRNKSKFYNGNRIKKERDPLITAIVKDNFELVQNIVNKSGLNFCEKWLEGYAPLCTAIKFHRKQMALWFLSKDCRINRNEDDVISDTPIHLATYCNEYDIAKALIEKGACLNVKNKKGQTPLHLSCLQRNVVITELLLKNEIIADVPDSQLTTPLHIAVEIECLLIIELLLNHKINVNTYTLKDGFKGFTPLHMAIYKKNKNIIKILLDYGADLSAPITISNVNGFDDENLTNFMNYQDFMPLHLASKLNNSNIIRLLLDNNADVNAVIECSGLKQTKGRMFYTWLWKVIGFN